MIFKAKSVIAATAALFLLTAVPPATCETAAQQAQPGTLTVDDVVKLVQAGVPEDLVLAKIRKSGKTFDLSTDDLLKLKKAGAGDAVLRALSDPGAAPAVAVPQPAGAIAQDPGAAPTPAGDASAVSAPLPDETGVYWIEKGTKLQRLEGLAVSNTRSGSTLASGLTLGIKRARINAQLNGARSQMRVGERVPQFYFYLPEEASIGDYLLLRLVQRLDVRQVEVGEKTLWKQQAGVDHTKQVDFKYTRIKNRIYLVTPKSDLAAGEYGFFIASGVETKKATGRIYDFGVE